MIIGVGNEINNTKVGDIIMTMQARLSTDACGNITVHMEGGLDFDNQIPFRTELSTMIKSSPASQITLDLSGLDFVGSSGIGHFVETLKILNTKKANIKLSNVKTEFIRVFKLYDLDAFELMHQAFDDDETENLNTKFGNRKRTFQH